MHRYSNLPASELENLRKLQKLKIEDSPYETLFDSITVSIAEICHCHTALISFLEEDCKWFKSKVGMGNTTHIPLELAFCEQTVLSNHILEIPDATLDERFKHNPLVVGEPFIRFFAGAPISLPLGDPIGSLCVIDHKPNKLNDHQKIALNGFAKVISQALLIRDVHLRTALGVRNGKQT